MSKISIVLIFLTVTCSGCGIGRFLVGTRESPPYQLKEQTVLLHNQLTVVDLHADSLLWSRNLLEKGSYGHVDIPRLQEANMTLEVFSVVTEVPYGGVTALSVFQLWHPRNWFSTFERALYQADKLEQIVNQSKDDFIFVKNKKDLRQLMSLRNQNKKTLGLLLSLEGVHALEGDLANLDKLYEVGFRMIGLAHLFNDKAGGSSDEFDNKGLSDWGKELVHQIEARNMILDLAHSSDKTIDDVLKISSKPVVVSHTGVRGTCDNPRNLSDRQIRGIAKTGGIIGIAAFKRAVCGETLNDTVRAILYVKNLVGIDHVAIGMDFDGSVTTPVDVTGLPILTELLMEQGLSDSEIRKIMGENAIHFLTKALPAT